MTRIDGPGNLVAGPFLLRGLLVLQRVTQLARAIVGRIDVQRTLRVAARRFLLTAQFDF
jgi:hypothetical protein